MKRIFVLALGALVAGILSVGCTTASAENAYTESARTEGAINAVDTAFVQEHLSTAKLVDTRTFEEFAGKTGDDRPGHIPGAINFCSAKLIDKKGEPLSSTRLVRMFTHQTLEPEDEIIVYGATDAEGSYQVAEALVANGYQNVSVYEGGYADWTSDAENEVDAEVSVCCALPE